MKSIDDEIKEQLIRKANSIWQNKLLEAFDAVRTNPVLQGLSFPIAGGSSTTNLENSLRGDDAYKAIGYAEAKKKFVTKYVEDHQHQLVYKVLHEIE